MGPDKIRHTDIAENEYDAIFDYLLKKHISVPKEDVPAIKKLLADNGQEYENIAIRRAYNLAIKIRNLDHDVLSTAEADNISNGLGTYNVSSATVERVFGWYRQWKSKQKVDKLEVVTPDKTSEVSVDLGKHFDDLYKTGVRLAKDMRSMCIDPKYAVDDIGCILLDMQDHKGAKPYEFLLVRGLLEHVKAELAFDYENTIFKYYSHQDLVAFETILARHSFEGTCKICEKKLKRSAESPK